MAADRRKERAVNVILFAKKLSDKCGSRLLSAVASEASEENLEIIRSFRSLAERLYRIPKRIAVMVLLAADQKQLSELVSISELMEDLRIILVLPDREGKTFSRGNTLRPRFLTYTDHGIDDVAPVLRKMLANCGHSNRQ